LAVSTEALAVAPAAHLTCGHIRSFRWHVRVIDDAADDPALGQPEAFVTAVRATLGPAETHEAEL
jgi:hypothetical protein